jgi:outer membrane protein W
MTDRVFLNLDLRYMPWSAEAEDAEIDESLALDPMIVSAGVKFRW